MADKELDIENVHEDETVKKPAYKSKDGFENIKVRRGFTEIKYLVQIMSDFDVSICGGYPRYMASPAKNVSKAGDVDIYCADEKVFDKVKSYLIDVEKLDIRHENDMAITFKLVEDYNHTLYGCPTIQLIKPVEDGAIKAVGSMEKILSNFDFSIVRAGFIDADTIMVDADFMHDEKNKILRIKNIHCPISSLLRCCKYAKKGYWLPAFQALRLFMDWESRSPEYRLRIIDFLHKSESEGGLTKEEINELEALLNVD